MSEWHIITCEYPPQVGGVGDHTEMLSNALRNAGDAVHIWAPGNNTIGDSCVHRVLGNFEKDSLGHADSLLNSFAPPRVLFVQWVPHGYGRRSMNIGFCRWLERRVHKHGDILQLMVHEPFLEFRGIGQSAAAAVHRWMIWRLLRVSERVWLSIPSWERMLRPFAPADLTMEWLPAVNTIPVCVKGIESHELHNRFAGPNILAGHFGTYSASIRRMLDPLVVRLLRRFSSLRFLYLGDSGRNARDDLIARNPDLADRLFATGYLPPSELSNHLSACDLLIQPYPDGASSRRSSLLASIAHGIPTVTTSGHLSESLWNASQAVAIVPANDPQALEASACALVESASERQRLATAGKNLYHDYFDITNTASKLQRGYPREIRASMSYSGHQAR